MFSNHHVRQHWWDAESQGHTPCTSVCVCVCVYKHQCTSLCRSPVCSANRLTSPATSAGLSSAAASFLGLQISVPLRDPGPSHSQPALSGGAEGFWSSCDPDPDKCDPIRLSPPAGLWSTVVVTPQRLPGRQRDRLWKAAEACHVTDTHLSPPWNTQRCPTEVSIWYLVHLFWWESDLWWETGQSTKSQIRAVDQGSVSNGSALFFASRCSMSFKCLCDAAAPGPNWIRQKVFQNADAFIFCRRSWNSWVDHSGQV